MEKVLKFLKNRWFLLGISFLSLFYVIFVAELVRISFTCYIKINNFNSFFALYLFINFLFGVLMFFTRKQIPTIITSIATLFLSAALPITAFGEWYLVIPPIIVSFFIFLLSGAGESCKVVLGTIAMLIIVVGTLAYSFFYNNLGISLYFVITDQEIDFSIRNEDYLVSPNGTYRLVKYVDESDDRTTTIYYVENAAEDEEYPFVDCYKVYGCRHILSTIYSQTAPPRWVNDDNLFIDGRVRSMEELFSDEPADTQQTSDTTAEESEDTEDTEEETE